MSRAISVRIVGDASDLERALKRASRSTETFGKKLSGAFAGFGVGLLGGLGLGGIGDTFKKMVGGASDLTEAIGKNKVLFGDSAAAIQSWSKTTANALGISQTAALNATGTFGAMLVPMGIAEPKAAAMSKSLVKLAGDLASFHNVDPGQVLEDLRSGLAGEAEPLRKYGIQISAARIQTVAASLGFTKGAQAAKQAKQAYTDAGSALRTTQKAQTTATANLTSAQSALKAANSAVQQSARAVAAAQDKLTTATQAVATAKDREQSASERLTAANTTLQGAQKASKDAQVALTQARKDAAEQIKSLKDATIDAGLSEKRAQLSLAQARARLAEVMADSTATDLDKRDAILGVQEAERTAELATKNRRDTAKKAADADKKGVAGSKLVVDAKKKVLDTHAAEQKAIQGVATASRNFLAAQRGMATALTNFAKAQQTLADAQAKSQTAHTNQVAAQGKVADALKKARKATADAQQAEDKYNKAKERSEQLNKGGVTGLTAQQKVLAINKIMFDDSQKALGDAGRTGKNFAGAMRRLGALVNDNLTKLGEQLVPALAGLINSIVDWLVKPENQKAIADAFQSVLDVVIPAFQTIKDWVTDTGNQMAVMDTIKSVMDTARTAVRLLRGAFHLLSGVVGGNKEAFKLLIEFYAAWKVGTIVGKVGQLAAAMGGPGGLRGKTRGARLSAKGLASVLSGGGNAGVVGAVALASIALSEMIRQIPYWDKAMRDFGKTIYDVAQKLGLIKDPFKGTTAPDAKTAGVVRQQAAQLEARGLTPSQAAARLGPRFPSLAAWDIQSLAGVRGNRPQLNVNGPVNVYGIPDPRKWEDYMITRAKRRPQSRR